MADIPGDATTNEVVGVGDTITGSLETAGDHDWFAITLVAGQQISILVDVVTLEDPYVYIRNANGVILGEDDDDGSGRGSRAAFGAVLIGFGSLLP